MYIAYILINSEWFAKHNDLSALQRKVKP